MNCAVKYMHVFLMLLCGIPKTVLSQQDPVDSLTILLKKYSPATPDFAHDTNRLRVLVQLSEVCDLNEILKYSQSALTLAEKLLNTKSGEAIRPALLNRKASALNNIGFHYMNLGDFSGAMNHYNKSLQIQRDIGDKKAIAYTLNNIGVLNDNHGHFEEALKYYKQSLKIQEETGDKYGIATSLNNIGELYNNQGDIKSSLDYYSKSLKLYEEINYKQGISNLLHNLASTHQNLGESVKALDYYNRSLKINIEISNKEGTANSLQDIGSVYFSQSDYIKAADFYKKSYEIRNDIGHKEGLARSLNSLGAVYSNTGELTKAIDYYNRSLKIQEEINNKRGVAHSLSNIARVYVTKKKYAPAFSNASRALTLSKELGFPQEIRNAEFTMVLVDSAMGNHAGAYEHYKQYIKFRDSILNAETRKAGIRNQLKYEFEKKEAVIKEQQEKERAVSLEKSRFQQIVILAVAIGLFLVMIFAVYIFRTLSITRKQKIVIEEKQKEILDSIYYARRIQKSLLPNETYILKIINRLQNRK